jgi:uncharacterized membrane protein YcaP (DUF421 family)
MAQVKKKIGKSEVSLIKEYCSRVTDEDLQNLSQLLPQQIAGDRSLACATLQKDKEVDKWLAQASSAEEWFNKVDSIGEIASAEIEVRNSKKK